MSPINDAHDVVAIDGVGNGPAEFVGAEPATLVIGQRGGGHLIEEDHFPIERRAGIHHRARRFRRQPVVHLRIQLVHDIELAAAETKQLQFAILLDVEADGIEIGQPAAVGVVLPVVRIAAEQYV